ncbi:hypothetical protein SASPL_103317 [Salvia splendens]|uniref:Aluminum-activated malate transporter n=1 Tax=Salvia splendens TaxID=180675 RepID=A0A8X8YXL7_SALSN|nr:hypothetical protein SASPL_103317 [Salvia splendens]
MVSEGGFHRIWRSWNNVKGTALKLREMGRSDPRKVVFAIKMGFCLSLVSVLIFFKEPSTFITQNYFWAMLTVVLVFEFSIGATLNRGFRNSLCRSTESRHRRAVRESWRMARIHCCSLASYLKLYPAMKQYEYGFRVFVLTFCLMLVSGTSNFFQTAVTRSLLIAVGAGVCLVVNVCVYPICVGEDLHKLVVENFKGVAGSIEGCVNMYLQCVEYSRIPSKILIFRASDDPLYKGYRAAVESTCQEETLFGFAVWEPPHGRYKMYRCPWSEYVKASSESRQAFKDGIQRVGTEGAKVLRMLGDEVEKMEKLSAGDPNWEATKPPEKAVDPDLLQELRDNEERHASLGDGAHLRSTQTMRNPEEQSMWPSHLSVIGDALLNEHEVRTYESASALSLANFTSLLIEFVARLQNLVNSFKELSEKVKFADSAETQEVAGFWSRTLKIESLYALQRLEIHRVVVLEEQSSKKHRNL